SEADVEAGGVAGGPGRARGVPRLDGASADEDDRNAGGRRLRGPRGGRTSDGDDQVDAESDQLLRQAWQPLVVVVGPPVLDGEIPPFDVAEVPEPLSERLVVRLPARRRLGRQVPDPSRLRPRRLRLGGQWCGEEGGRQ